MSLFRRCSLNPVPKIWLVGFFIILLIPNLLSGKTTIVELWQNLNVAKTNTAKLNAYVSLFRYYEYSNPDSVNFYAQKGLADFSSTNYKPGMASMLSILAGAYSAHSQLEIAKKADDQALEIYTELNDESGIANTNNVLGVIDGRRSNYPGAIQHFFVALKIYEKINDTGGISDTYTKLGTANERSGNLDKALEYFRKGLSIYPDTQVNDNTIFLNNNIGSVYAEKKDFINSKKYLEIALKKSEDKAFAQIRILPLSNMADIYCKMGDTLRAISYSNQALAIAEQENLPEDKARILITMTQFIAQTDDRKALVMLDSVLNIAQSIGDKNIEVEALANKINIYKNKGDFKTAFTLLQLQMSISDSIINTDKEQTTANLEALYRFDQLNTRVQLLVSAEQKQQQKKNAVIVIAIFLFLFLLVVVLLFWRTRLLNRQLYKKDIELEKSGAIKNRLISIIAHDLIGAISFMPFALGLTRNKTIPEEERDQLLGELELSAIASSETLQNMLDWGKAQILGIVMKQVETNVHEIIGGVMKLINISAHAKAITIKDNVDSGTRVCADPDHLKFIFRNLLSNAVKYTPENGMILMDATKDGDNIVFSVKDNGNGLTREQQATIFENSSLTSQTDNPKGNGIGLQLCKEFVEQNGGKIWVESELSKGSTFFFSMKAA